MAVTPNYGWSIPTVNGSADTWGTTLNVTINAIDAEEARNLKKAGGTMTGALVTQTSGTGGAGLQIPPGTAPTSPVNGEVWGTAAGGLFYRRGGATKTLAELEGSSFTGPVSFATTPTCANAPASGSDLANKTYVDSIAAGLQPKTAVALASTANIASLSGEQTIDGTLTSATRILVKDQSSAAANGIYTTGAGAWTRTTDMDAWSEVPGALAYVTGGSDNAGKRYYCTSTAGGTLGTTAINFIFYDSTTLYTASGGVTLSGADFRLSNMAEGTFKMRAAGSGTGAPIDGTPTQATAALNAVVGATDVANGTKGLAPAALIAERGLAFLGDGTYSGLPLYAAGYGVNAGTAMSFTGAVNITSFTRSSNGKWILVVDDALEDGWSATITTVYSGSTVLIAGEDQTVAARSSTGTGYQFRTAGNTLQDPAGVNIQVYGVRA